MTVAVLDASHEISQQTKDTMKKTLKLGFLAACVAVAAGCASSHVVPEPGKITLENALRAVGEGLYEMKVAQKDVKTGLIPSEVTVKFNITASGTDDGKLYVELSSVPAAGATGKAGGELGSRLSAERGNQITVKFTNILLAETNSLVFTKTPDEIKLLLDTLQKAGIQVYKVPEPRVLPE